MTSVALDRAATFETKRLFIAVAALALSERPSDTHAAVYEFHDSAGTPIYVGSTDRLESRLTEHRRQSSWAQFAATGHVTWHPSLGAARIAELKAIGAKQPKFNIAGTSPGARARLVAYLVAHGRLDLLTPAVKLA